MQNTIYLNHVPHKNEKYTKKGIEIYLENEEKGDDDIFLLFNGEIYNSREICKTLLIDYQSVEHTIKIAYKVYGIEETVRILDGQYSFVLIDYNIYSETAKIYLARDVIGIYPLYIHTIPIGKVLLQNSPSILRRLDLIDGFTDKLLYDKYIISSKPLAAMNSRTCLPGSYSEFSLPFCVNAKWEYDGETRVSTLAIMPLLDGGGFDYLGTLFEQSVAKMIGEADKVVCIAGDVYGFYMAKIAREICLSQKKEFMSLKNWSCPIGNNTVVLHTGKMEEIFQIRETNPVIENRALRDHIENNSLYDIRRVYENEGIRFVRFPFWDITWIQFYMTMPAKYRREFLKKYFL
jgi:hypothetical protein